MGQWTLTRRCSHPHGAGIWKTAAFTYIQVSSFQITPRFNSRRCKRGRCFSRSQFVALCKKHNVVIITPYKEFDFNATRRNDRRDFLKEADEGADYLESHQRMMLKAKERKGMRGDYAGHAVPTGLMLDEKRKGYLPNPYWCETVRWLTHRF